MTYLSLALTISVLLLSPAVFCVSASSLLSAVNLCRYLVRKGVIQATLKGRQWRHGVVVWAFMVAGLIGRRLPGSTDPCFVSQRRRPRQGAGSATRRGGASATGSPAADYGCGDDDGFETNSDADSEASRGGRAGRAPSDTGTDGTMSGGEERIEDAPVQQAAEASEAYKEVFGDRPMHEAVLQVVCLAARLMGKLCGDNKADDAGNTEAEALSLQREAYDFVCRFVAVLFGPVNTTKMHALAFHLMDELMSRGNLVEADTSVNEALHGLLKALFENTNKQTTSFAVQMLRCEQTLAHVVAEDAEDKMRAAAGVPPVVGESMDHPDAVHYTAYMLSFSAVGRGAVHDGSHPSTPHAPDNSEQSCASVDEGADDADDETADDVMRRAKRARPAAGGGRRRRRRRVRVRGHRVAVADLLTGDGGRLQEVGGLLGVTHKQHLTVANSVKFEAVLGWRTCRLDQHIRAARDFYRKPWYDFIHYRDADRPGEPQLGLARLIVRAVDGQRRDVIVVQRMEAAEPRKGCVLTDFGCQRFKWVINDATGFPSLAAVKLIDVQRLENVVPDFEDLCERHGLRGTPVTIPDTLQERVRQRYFTNIFFPWTSSSIDECPGQRGYD